MLNKSVKSRYPCLVPDLRRNIFSFSLIQYDVDCGLSYIAFIRFKYELCISDLLRILIMNGCWILSYTLHLLRWLYDFYHSLCWCDIWHWLLWYVETSLKHPTWSWWMIFLICWIKYINILCYTRKILCS